MRKPCCDIKLDLNKGAWSKQEDHKLIDYINTNPNVCWRTLPQAAGLLRCGKSCRLRWINYLRPDLKRGNFGEDEEELIIKLHALLGNRWSLIAGRLPGRTDNEVKNYWNSHIRRKLICKGIDPNNHRLISHKIIPSSPPRLHNPTVVVSTNSSKSLSSSGLKLGISTTTKSCADNYYGKVFSSDYAAAASNGVEEDDSNNNNAALPDLNLDLTMNITPSSSSAPSSITINGDENNLSPPIHESKSSSCRDPPFISSPSTLLLFQ